jgi:hypothetical protein
MVVVGAVVVGDVVVVGALDVTNEVDAVFNGVVAGTDTGETVVDAAETVLTGLQPRVATWNWVTVVES